MPERWLGPLTTGAESFMLCSDGRPLSPFLRDARGG